MMNKTNIEWTDFTWNPITGCNRGCEYCYARKMFHRFKKSFEPEFHPDRLVSPIKRKKPSMIFACSVSDFFAPWTKQEWRDEVIKVIEQCPQHTFQILTKSPEGITSLPKNAWIGCTVTKQEDLDGLNQLVKHTHQGFLMKQLNTTFVSFEPLLGPIDFRKCSLDAIDWVIIGAQTNPNKQPDSEWVETIIKEARNWGCKIFLKDNLKMDKIQEFPEGLHV